MILFYIAFFILCIYRIQISKTSFFDDVLSKDRCNAIKGLFILFVFVRHLLQYIEKSGYIGSPFWDKPLLLIDQKLGQLIVVMFLFYSGYGVMESILKKKDSYILSMPKNRILPTFMNFAIAVFVFAIADLILGKVLTIPTYLQALIGWISIGNSNWYIFVIILCYIITFISFVIFRERNLSLHLRGLFILFLSLCFIFILSHYQKPHWYNTILAFSFGIFFSIHKQKLDFLIRNHYKKILLALFILFIALKAIHSDFLYLKYNLTACIFALLIVALSYKIKIENQPLKWLGMNLFPLYIYQRLPMMILYSINNGEFVKSHAYIYMALCLLFTITIAYLFHFWQYTPKKAASKSSR